jgi:hypothetical protein
MRALTQLPSFHAKSQVLEIDKLFSVSEQGISQGGSFTEDLFHYDRVKYGRGEVKRKRNISCFPCKKWEQRLKMMIQYLCSYTFLDERIQATQNLTTLSLHNGSEWPKWILFIM